MTGRRRMLVHHDHARAYFDLQLRFADVVATRSSRPLAEVVAWYASLRRTGGCSRAYTASVRPPDSALHFHGSSSWGAFLDHQGRLKLEAGRQFLDNLRELDVTRLRDTFPLPALQADASLARRVPAAALSAAQVISSPPIFRIDPFLAWLKAF